MKRDTVTRPSIFRSKLRDGHEMQAVGNCLGRRTIEALNPVRIRVQTVGMSGLAAAEIRLLRDIRVRAGRVRTQQCGPPYETYSL
jgi:hypothetical protein